MSIRYEIKDKDDVEFSEDHEEIEILFNNDNTGNYYVDVPVKFIIDLLGGRVEGQIETVVSGRYSLQELFDKFNEFIKTEEYKVNHGNIENRHEICQWGFYWFINWMKKNQEAH